MNVERNIYTYVLYFLMLIFCIGLNVILGCNGSESIITDLPASHFDYYEFSSNVVDSVFCYYDRGFYWDAGISSYSYDPSFEGIWLCDYKSRTVDRISTIGRQSSISFDGKLIAVSNNGGIYILDRSGGDIINVMQGRRCGNSSWSYDPCALFFEAVKLDGHGFDIWKYSFQDSSLVCIHGGLNDSYRFPVVDNSRNRVFCLHFDWTADYWFGPVIESSNIDGSNVLLESFLRRDYQSLSLSSDCTRLLYLVKSSNGNFSVRQYNLINDVEDVLSINYAFYPVWFDLCSVLYVYRSPDNAVMGDGMLWLYNIYTNHCAPIEFILR